MHRGPRSIPLCMHHHIQLTSLSFQVSRPSHSWCTAISIFYHENLRSRSWVRSKLKVTTWVQHFIDSHPFCSMSIGHPIPEIRLFLNFQGQAHGWGERWKSGVTSYWVTSLSFHVNWPFHFWDTKFLNLTLKIQGEGEMTMLHNYRSGQFHITLNGINPSSGFRESLAQVHKVSPKCCLIWKVLRHGQAHMGQIGKLQWQCTTTKI